MRVVTLLAATFLFLSCSDDGPLETEDSGKEIVVSSHPSGAAILIDGENTGRVTPDTLLLPPGEYLVEARLDLDAGLYRHAREVEVTEQDEVLSIELVPLAQQWGRIRWHEAAGMEFAVTTSGSLFHELGSRWGLVMPAGSTNTYVSSGMPAVAGMLAGQPVALGLYDHRILNGRPGQEYAFNANGSFELAQTTWVVPSSPTVRGIEIDEEVFADNAVEGAILVRLTYRNITAEPLVALLGGPSAGGPATYENTWVGMIVDADVGSSGEDNVSYDLERDMVFTYDSDFHDEAFFEGDDASAPRFVGIAMLEAPEQTTVLLNSWTSAGDWQASVAGTQAAGYGMLTGSSIYEPDHPHERLGWMSEQPGDVRMSVTAGPLSLAPGEEATVVIAIALAPPAAGTFTSGTDVAPGDPFDTTRQLYGIAANLRTKMAAAAAMQQSMSEE